MTDSTTEPEIVQDSELPDPEVQRHGSGNGDASTADPDTFPREVVEKLREEAAGYRVKAKDRDNLARRLHVALVAATGRLADPTDLAFDEAHLEDAAALSAALEDLIVRKPHLASRKPSGDIGQGASPYAGGVSLAGILRQAAS